MAASLISSETQGIKRFDKSKKRQMAPGPRGYRWIGSLLNVWRDRLGFVTKMTAEYGDLVGFRMGRRRLFLLNHPDYARHVLCEHQDNYRKGLGLAEAKPLLGQGLLTSEGEMWSQHRRLLQRAFSGERIEEYGQIMVQVIHSMLERWREYAETGAEVDVAQEMVRLTLNILGLTLFGSNLAHIADEMAADFALLMRWAMTRMMTLAVIPARILTPGNRQARRALRRLDLTVRREILLPHRNNERGNDLVSLLMTQLADGQQASQERQLRDEVMTFLLAGHETIAATLAWTWNLLAQHPEVENLLALELKSTLADRKPALADLPHLAYTQMVIEEVLRLYPPVWLLPRKAIHEDKIGGYQIPADSEILLSVYSLHRHPSFWENPERFDPERFNLNRSAHRTPCSYLPFGVGPRTCLGSRFGMMEAMLVLATVAQQYRCELVPGFCVEPEAALTLRPRRGLLMRIVKRR